MTELYKVLDPDGTARITGFQWPLPKRPGRPGRWVTVKGDLRMCGVGLHVTAQETLSTWIPAVGRFVVWRVEVDGDSIKGSDKSAWRRARLIEPVIVVDTDELLKVWQAFTKADKVWKRQPNLPMLWQRFLRFRDPANRARPIFGVDELPAAERICPAWPAASTIESQRHQAMVRRTRRILGIDPAIDRAVQSLSRHGQLAAAFELAGWRQR